MGRVEWVALVTGLAVMGAGRVTAAAPVGSPAHPETVQSQGGTVVVKVADYDPARRRVVDAARVLGAEVLHSRTETDFQGKKVGRLQLRLPAEQLPQLLPAVRAVGKLYAESIRTRDETSAHEELGERIARLREQGRDLIED